MGMDNSEILARCLVEQQGRDLLKHATSFGKGLDRFALFTLERYLEGEIDFDETFQQLTESYTDPKKVNRRYFLAIAKKVLPWILILALIIYIVLAGS